MHRYREMYWYLHFMGKEDMGYDFDIIDVEAEDEATAISIAKIRAPRGAKKFSIYDGS